MKQTMLLPFLLQVRYTGVSADATFKFEKTGGTSAGKLTLSIGSDDEEFDFGVTATNTLTKLVDAINDEDDWEARACLGADPDVSLTTANLTRAVDDLSETIAEPYRWMVPVPFENAYDTVAGSTTAALSSRQAVDVQGIEQCRVQFEITGTDAGASGNVTLGWQCNNVSGKTAYLPLADGDEPPEGDYAGIKADGWDNQPVDDETVVIAVSGTDTIRKSFTMNLDGIQFIRLHDVENGDTNTVRVKAYLTT